MEEISEQSIRRKEDISIYIIREAIARSKRPALLWSLGKDSTAMLYLVRKAYYGQVPMPVVHLDTTQKFPEMYAFRDRWAKAWSLDLIVGCNQEALSEGVHCCMDREMTCCHRLKTEALRQLVNQYQFDALLVGIRRDEHGVRAKERYFSPRDASFGWNYSRQPIELPGVTTAMPNASSIRKSESEHLHFRVHPLLHWSEIDIWSYTRMEEIPLVDLYLANNGRRYRSLGCQPATNPVISDASTIDEIINELCTTKQAERSGRAQDKESAYRMERLRSLGYL